MTKHTELFSELFREIESDLGTREMSLLVMEALINSIDTFKCNDREDFLEQFAELVEIISNTEPKFGVLNYNFAGLLHIFSDRLKGVSGKDLKKKSIKYIREIIGSCRGEENKLIINAEKINVEGKTILIHDHSHTVQDVLSHFKKMGRKFKVIIAEQDYDKTHSNIEKMHNLGVPFQVVPAYMLSHVHDTIDMAFFGAVTLKDTMHFVMDPGTHGIISELHMEQIPVHMFIETKKFSLWRSKARGEIFIHQHIRKHLFKPIEYERIKYSHDRAEVKLFTKIVTDSGVFNPDELKKFFEQKLAKELLS